MIRIVLQTETDAFQKLTITQSATMHDYVVFYADDTSDFRQHPGVINFVLDHQDEYGLKLKVAEFGPTPLHVPFEIKVDDEGCEYVTFDTDNMIVSKLDEQIEMMDEITDAEAAKRWHELVELSKMIKSL